MARSRLARVAIPLAWLLLVQGSARADTYLLVVSGIGGEPAYGDTFHRWSTQMLDVAEEELGIPRERVTYLAEKPERAPDRIDDESKKQALEDAIERLAARTGAGDTVVVLYFGHGNAVDNTAMLNLPGPDISAGELAEALAPLASRTLVVVVTSASSGPFAAALSAPNRIIITATRTGAEDNHTLFGGYFVQAFSEDNADTDKNGRVSLLEAFQYARHEVGREYRTDNRLLTEHAVLDDNGDGKGSPDPETLGDDGVLASSVHLEDIAHATAPTGVVDGELASLIERKAELEAAIAALKREKETMTAQAYEDELETLLVELALNRRAIREAQDGP